MAREARLLLAFVDFAEALAVAAGPAETAVELARRAGDEFGIEATTVLLAQLDGTLAAAAWTTEPARQEARLELEHAEGPGHDAVRAGAPVVTRRGEDVAGRWPRFGPDATRAALHSFAAIPMRRRGGAVGALVLASGADETVDPVDIVVLQALADVATLAITEERAAHHARAVAAQLQTALDARVVIEQAKGVVAEHERVTVDDAFTALRQYARGRHQLLTDVAQRVVGGELDPAAVVRDRSGIPRGAP